MALKKMDVHMHKNGVGFLYVKVLVTQLCLTLETPRNVACQDPVSMDFPGKNTGVGHHFLLHGIFPTQGSNPGLLHWQADSFTTEPPGKPDLCEYLDTN